MNKRIMYIMLIFSILLSTLIIPMQGIDSLTNINSENYSILNESELPDIITIEQSEKYGHVQRMPLLEDNLTTLTFNNYDNTNTTYIFSENVKYVDVNGNIQDKTNKLYKNGDYYFNKDNDISLNIPSSTEKPIIIKYINYQLSIIPCDINSSDIELFNNTTHGKPDSITFKNVFNGDAYIKYSPMFSGLKEDIVLNTHINKNVFSFEIDTENLTLKLIDNIPCFISDDNDDIVMKLGAIDVFDASGKYSSGLYNVKVLDNGKYVVDIIINDEFLKAEDTVYPVVIDPTITIATSGSGSSKTIEDAPLYSNQTSLLTGDSYYNNVGYISSTYGYSRSITKFPGLMSYFSTYHIIEPMITSIYYKTYCIVAPTISSYTNIYQFTGNDWSESTVTSGSAGMSYGTTSYASLSPTTNNQLCAFNITQVVKTWLTGNNTNYNKGILLKASNETSTSYLARYASTEYSNSSYRPSIEFTYSTNIYYGSNPVTGFSVGSISGHDLNTLKFSSTSYPSVNNLTFMQMANQYQGCVVSSYAMVFYKLGKYTYKYDYRLNETRNLYPDPFTCTLANIAVSGTWSGTSGGIISYAGTSHPQLVSYGNIVSPFNVTRGYSNLSIDGNDAAYRSNAASITTALASHPEGIVVRNGINTHSFVVVNSTYTAATPIASIDSCFTVLDPASNGNMISFVNSWSYLTNNTRFNNLKQYEYFS